MASSGPPQRTAEGELVLRPSSPFLPSSPAHAYTNHGRQSYSHSPERNPSKTNGPFVPNTPDINPREGGLRRRPSQQNDRGRRYSLDELDRPPFPGDSNSQSSRRPLRARDDGCYRDDERTFGRRNEVSQHPDYYERSRPPRSYRNTDWDRVPGPASKPYFSETGGDRDLERGEGGFAKSRRNEDEYEVDTYTYGKEERAFNVKDLTPQERAEVMRLPWTQWMTSDIKNRKYFSLAVVLLIPSSLPSLWI